MLTVPLIPSVPKYFFFIYLYNNLITQHSIYNNNKCEYNDNAIIERNLNCVISIIIYKEHSTKLYDNIKLII